MSDEAGREADGATVEEALAAGERRLAAAGIESPRVDAELIAQKALGLTRTELYLDPARVLPADAWAGFGRLVDRRADREPLAYVLGGWGFRRLTLKVDRRVLIPRPETEAVVERCLELLRAIATPAVLDVGTGSGAIALAIADEHPGARVTAIDASADALQLAAENADATGIAIALEQRDIEEGLAGAYDLIVSNPPYVSAQEIEALEPEVRDWEPRIATVGDGHTALIAEQATHALVPGGHLVLEVGDGRAGEVSGLLRDRGYADVRASRDLAGRDRVVEGRWSSAR